MYTANPASRDYLAFRLGDEHYGIDITKVREIRQMEPVTRLVEAPNHVKGVINLRGEIVLVTDLRTRLGMEPPEAASQSVMIVIDAGSTVGMVVDGVTDVIALRGSDIHLPPTLDGAVDERFVQGVASTQAGILIVLDVEPLLTRRAPGETLQ